MTREDIDRFLSENKDIASSIKSIAEKYKLSVQKVSWQISLRHQCNAEYIYVCKP